MKRTNESAWHASSRHHTTSVVYGWPRLTGVCFWKWAVTQQHLQHEEQEEWWIRYRLSLSWLKEGRWRMQTSYGCTFFLFHWGGFLLQLRPRWLFHLRAGLLLSWQEEVISYWLFTEKHQWRVALHWTALKHNPVFKWNRAHRCSKSEKCKMPKIWKQIMELISNKRDRLAGTRAAFIFNFFFLKKALIKGCFTRAFHMFAQK